ncbi:hypothetical protein M422DRAFT_94263, partial [Sphaerobolus stellatus SS14]
LGLLEAATIEWRLREGQAQDALRGLKVAIMNKLANQNHRKTHAQGYGPYTRAIDLINQQAEVIKKYSEAYKRSRVALLKLGFDGQDKNFQELKPEDCYTKAMFREQR